MDERFIDIFANTDCKNLERENSCNDEWLLSKSGINQLERDFQIIIVEKKILINE